MNMTRDRLRSAGWAAVLLVAFTFTVALTFKVNSVRSQVRLTERQILAVKQQKLLLETEFETRSNQQQLTSLNKVEFGYQAPAARQYLEGERQLAALGKPRDPGAPNPIRVAHDSQLAERSILPDMVEQFTGKAYAAEAGAAAHDAPLTRANLSERLGRLALGETARP